MEKRFWLAIITTAVWLTAITFNLSPWLRGPLEWRWPYVIPATVERGWLVVLLLLLYLAGAWWVLKAKKWQRPFAFLLACFMLPALQLALLYVDHPDPRSQLFLRTVSPEAGGFYNVGAMVTDTPAFLADFAQNMPSYPVHPQRHPPGLPLIFAEARQWLDGQPRIAEQLSDTFRPYQCHNYDLMNWPNSAIASAVLQMLLPLWLILTLPLLFIWGKLVGGEQTAVHALLLYPLLPSIGLWATRWNHLYAVFALGAMILFHLGLTQRRWLYFALAGVVVSVASFFSFGNVALLMFLGVYALVWLWREHGKNWQDWHVVWHAIGAGFLLLGTANVWLVVWLGYDLRLTAVWQEAMGTHLGLGRDYWVWLFYHLYDFFIFLGVPLLVLWLAQVQSGFSRPLRSLRSQRFSQLSVAWIAFTIGLLLLDLSGTSQGEVARVWAFLLPLALVVIIAPTRQPRLILLLAGLLGVQTAVSNLYLRPVGTGLLDPPALPALAESPLPIEATWQDGLQLAEAITTQEENALTLTATWHTSELPDKPYTLFVHLLDVNGELVAQADGLPEPLTTCWQAERPFTTTSTLTLPDTSGEYDLLVGWYWFPTLERLPLTNGSTAYTVTVTR